MPGPPPPPPPPGAPGAPPPPPGPAFKPAKNNSSGDPRNMLLQSIRQGKPLKKTVTLDKSAPLINGKTNTGAPPPPLGLGAGAGVANGVGARGPSASSAGPPALAGLFAGGMPKLRPVGGQSPRDVNKSNTLPHGTRLSPEKPKLQLQSSNSSNNDKSVVQQPSVSKLSQALGQALSAGFPRADSATLKRSPPPNENKVKQIQHPITNAPEIIPSVSQVLSTQYVQNVSTLSRMRNVSQSSTTVVTTATWNMNMAQNSQESSRNSSNADAGESVRINHGKPNLAPKPPGMTAQSHPIQEQSASSSSSDDKPSPPPKKPSINNGKPASRAQSMRVPKSPTVTNPAPLSFTADNGFRTLKPNAFHQSQDSIDKKTFAPQPPNARIAGRAPLRPPTHCPPPPPSRPANLGPPPPPPPHRQPTPTHNRSNSSNSGAPPQPPVRGSSMRPSSSEFESKFEKYFHQPSEFPFPDAFLRIEKTYSSVNVANMNVNKQQAPLPPTTHLQLSTKLWANNSSNC